MGISAFHRIIALVCFSAAFLFGLPSLSAQTKSEHVQTIDGRKFYIHKVEKKQSLYSISKIYNVSLEEIYQFNPDSKSGIRAGEELRIPFPAQIAASQGTIAAEAVDTLRYRVHVVSKGETVYGISRRFNISEAELKLYNPILISNPVREGQTLIVGEKRRLQGKAIVKTPVRIDSSNYVQVSKPKKNSYNLALLLPFRLESSLYADVVQLAKNNANFPAVPALAVDFYLGFKRAADSLSGEGFEVNLELYDINDKDSARLKQISSDPKFPQTDMIFGPLYANSFRSIALDARRAGVPIVSLMTQTNKMLFDNIYASKTRPSLFTLIESLADYCIDSLAHGGTNIILTAPVSNEAKEMSYVKAFRKYYNERQKQLGRSGKDTVTMVRGLAGVKNAYLHGVKNVVVTLSTNQVFIADFTTQLAIFADKKDIVLCGWQQISAMDNIDQQYLNQLQFTFPCEYDITGTRSFDPVAESYFEQQGTMPGENYFIGFDIGMYYLKNLKEHGPDFIFRLDEHPADLNYMRFKFSRPDNITGFDNRGVYIFHYNNYQLRKSGWK